MRLVKMMVSGFAAGLVWGSAVALAVVVGSAVLEVASILWGMR